MVDDISAVSTKRPDLDLRLHSQESPAGEVCTLVQWVTVFQVEHSDRGRYRKLPASPDDKTARRCGALTSPHPILDLSLWLSSFSVLRGTATNVMHWLPGPSSICLCECTALLGSTPTASHVVRCQRSFGGTREALRSRSLCLHVMEGPSVLLRLLLSLPQPHPLTAQLSLTAPGSFLRSKQ